MSHFFLLVFALVWTLVRCSCPTMCECKNYPVDSTQNDFYTVATCTNLPGGNVPQDFVEKLQEVTLINLDQSIVNGLQNLTVNFPNLQRLSLRNSSISLDNFTIPPNVTHLDLSWNNLDAWNQEDDLSTLRILDISYNSITVLRDFTFRTLNTLEVLNASFNNVSVLESKTFVDLHNLKCLDLSGNSIVRLTQEVFLPVTSLQYLNLSKNRLDTLSELSFDGLNRLQQLDLSWNNLRQLDPGSLELPSLTRLLLEGNVHLGSILVGIGRKLQTVDASSVGLQQVPPSLTPSIRTLKLERNLIQNINCGDLDSYPLLQVLDFTSNRIDLIEEDALGRLDSLTMLFLSDNKIREIPKSLPEKLEVLRIDRNEINKVSEGDLQGLTKLEVLALNDNKISIIGARAFSQLTSLVALDLSRNPISVLQPGCLQGPVYLQVLRLSGIDLISPAKDVSFPLAAPEHLITLDLSESPGLARQFLTDTAVLAASKQLQELDLRQTDSDVIRSDLLHYLPQLRSLLLEGNKLNCSNLRWLGAWMRRQDDRRHRDVACASPADLWGTLLVDLPEEEVETTTVPKVPTTSMSIRVTSASWTRERVNNTTPNNLDISSEKSTTSSVSPSTTTVGNSINSTNTKKTNDVPRLGHNVMPGIISRTSYRAVAEPQRGKKVNTPSVISRSSYTKVNDVPSPHREKSTTLFVDVVPNTVGQAHELSTAPEGSSYHPGMIISLIGLLIACAVAATFKNKITKRRHVTRRGGDIEVTSLPGVTELW